MSLRFEIVLTVEVADDSELEVVKEKISDCIYDLDDVEIIDVDITRRLD